MRKIFGLIFSVMFITVANAADNALETCLQKISADAKTWESGISAIFGNSELDDTNVEQNKARVYQLLSERFGSLCGTELVPIAKQNIERGQINFKHKNKDYAFDFSINRLYEDLGIQTGILVINKRDLYPTKILEKSSLPKSTSRLRPYRFFTDDCSDHTIWENLDDDAAVNYIGQSVFSEYGGTKNEFFLDFAVGDDNRAFPGLVLEDVTWSSEEKIVTYTNIKTAVERTQQFADKLKNSACSNQQLAVYLVALNVKEQPKTTVSGNRDTAATVTGSIAGAGLAVGGVSTGVLASSAGGAAAAAFGGAAGAVGWIPVAGWVVAGALGITAAAIAVWPQTIVDIKRVMILDGPYYL